MNMEQLTVMEVKNEPDSWCCEVSGSFSKRNWPGDGGAFSYGFSNGHRWRLDPSPFPVVPFPEV